MKKALLIFLLFVATKALAQKEYNVLPWKAEYTLNTYLVQQMKAQFAERKLRFEKAVISKKNITAYRDSCKKVYRQLMGILPQKTPLNAQIVGEIKTSFYTIQKIIFESFAGHHVTANFYLPAGKGPFAAALFFCGHEPESKATESYQRTAALFAKNGIAVFMIDPISQGERHQLTDKEGKPLTRGGTTEHTLLNAGSNLVGTSVPAYELFDNIRSLDYLETRPEIIKEKIGCIGNSGGGTQAAYFMAYDDRIKVAAPCSYISSRERSFELTGPSDGCVHFPYEQGMEMSDYLIMFAPKPALILAGRYDFVDYPGVEAAYAEAQKAYAAFGAPQNISLFTFDDGHGISAPKREAAIKWFRQWLYGDQNIIKEGAEPVQTEKMLWCTKSGDVTIEYKNEVAVHDRNLWLAQEAKKEREASQDNIVALQKKVEAALKLNTNNAPLQSEWLGEIKKEGYVIKKCILRKTGEPPMPALIIYPSGTVEKVVLWLDERGKNKIADSTALLKSFLQKNTAVIAADVRGIGETADKPEFNDPKYFNHEYRNTMLSLQIAKPLPGQQVQDVKTLLDFVKANPLLQKTQVEIHASGVLAPVALQAAFIGSRINKVVLYHSIHSYTALLQNPLMRDQYSYVIPNVLLYYDLPELAAYLGPEKILYKD